MALSPQELQIAEYGKAQGKSKEQVLAAIAKFRSTQQPQQPVAPITPPQIALTEPSLTDRLANIGDTASAAIKSNILGTGEHTLESPLQRGVQTTAAAFNVIPQAAVELAPKPVRSVLSSVGEGYKKLIDFFASHPAAPKLLQAQVEQNPELITQIENASKTGQGLGDIANTILAAEGAKTTLGKVADAAQTGVQTVKQGVQAINQTGGSIIDTTSNVIGTGAEKAKGLTQNLTQKVVKNVSEKNVSPQLQTSVENLTKSSIAPQVKGSAVAVKDPLKLYDELAAQEQKFKTNIKADTALNVVGERTGNAFEKVIKQRQAVGNVMGEELKKIGSLKTNTQGAFEDFRTQLRDSGVAYDVTNGKLGQIAKQTKFTASDKAQLQYYAKEFQKLGTNPTVSELDAFMSRIPKAIDVYKSSKSIVGTTNAERIIKGSLADLRKSLLDSGNPALDKYALARSQYSQLSDFVNEGASYLGKKTASGDFSRDASIAKSSVQSILNGGKKDWLLKLESLTGYKALDEAVLALQAMKDAGNFRGASLLDLLSPSELPTSKASLINKGIDYALQKGASKLVGSPAEQTRRLIQETINAQRTPQTTTTAISSPTGGQSTVTMTQSKNLSIPQSVPQQPISSIKVLPKLDAAAEKAKQGLVESAKNPSLGLATKDITKDYDTVAKALMEYDSSVPTMNFGKGNKMAAPLSEDAATLADLKAKLETGVLTKEEIATAGRLLQKEGAFGNPLIQEAKKYKTAEEFVKAQKTGDIPSGTYDSTVKSLSESSLLSKENNPVVVGKIGKYEIRESGRMNQYAKVDKNGEIVRSANGKALYLTPEEIKAKGLAEKDSTLVVFDGNKPVGYVMDSFGSPEISVAKEYQRKGIGSELLKRWMQKFPNKKIGQMTPEGEAMVKSQLTDIWKQAHPESNFSPEVQRIINMTQ